MGIAQIVARIVSEIEEPLRALAHWLLEGGFWRVVAFIIFVVIIKSIYDRFTTPRFPIG